MARVVGIKAGIPKEAPALTVNRLCGNGVQAIVSAAQAIKTGDADVALAGGAESMSRGAYWNLSERWGARMGDVKLIDAVVGSLTDPFDDIHMGMTAENLAESHSVSRERRMTSPSSRTAERRQRSKAASSRTKSCRSKSKRRGRPSSSRSTSTCAGTSPATSSRS